MRRWSVKPISSPPRPPRRAAGPGRRYVASCGPGCSPAGGADQAGNSLVQPEAAYRCRHGRTSATGPGPGQAKNTYVREDQILPHLAALAILATDDAMAHDSGTVQLTGPAQTADLVDQLRASGAVLTYDPDPARSAPSASGQRLDP